MWMIQESVKKTTAGTDTGSRGGKNAAFRKYEANHRPERRSAAAGKNIKQDTVIRLALQEKKPNLESRKGERCTPKKKSRTL